MHPFSWQLIQNNLANSSFPYIIEMLIPFKSSTRCCFPCMAVTLFLGWTAEFRGVEDQAGHGAYAVQVLFDYVLPPSVSPPLSVLQ